MSTATRGANSWADEAADTWGRWAAELVAALPLHPDVTALAARLEDRRANESPEGDVGAARERRDRARQRFDDALALRRTLVEQGGGELLRERCGCDARFVGSVPTGSGHGDVLYVFELLAYASAAFASLQWEPGQRHDERPRLALSPLAVETMQEAIRSLRDPDHRTRWTRIA